MVGEYEQKWQAVLDALRASASTLGLQPEAIRRGEFGRKPSASPPYLLVYLEPEASVASAGGDILDLRYRLIVFSVEADADQAKAITTAWDRAVKAYEVLRNQHLAIIPPDGTPPLRVDFVSGNLAVVVLEMEAW